MTRTPPKPAGAEYVCVERETLKDAYAVLCGTFKEGEYDCLLRRLDKALAASPPAADAGDENEDEFQRGVHHLMVMLAETIGSKDWYIQDGIEERDTVIKMTLLDVLEKAGMYENDHGTFARFAPAGSGGDVVERAKAFVLEWLQECRATVTNKDEKSRAPEAIDMWESVLLRRSGDAVREWAVNLMMEKAQECQEEAAKAPDYKIIFNTRAEAFRDAAFWLKTEALAFPASDVQSQDVAGMPDLAGWEGHNIIEKAKGEAAERYPDPFGDSIYSEEERIASSAASHEQACFVDGARFGLQELIRALPASVPAPVVEAEARAIAHRHNKRCTGGEYQPGDANRWHSESCDALTKDILTLLPAGTADAEAEVKT